MASARPRGRPPLVKRLKAVNVELISRDFQTYLQSFEEWAGFGEPSVHFYERLMLRACGRQFNELATDSLFQDYAYAALATWGMHRPGSRGPKLAEFSVFVDGVRVCIETTSALAKLSILDVAGDSIDDIANQLAPLLDTKILTRSKETLIANSKLLHFLLPNLVPPIDHEYTLTVLFGCRNLPDAPSEVMRVALGAFAFIGQRASEIIRDAVTAQRYMCAGHAKVIDNALVGFARVTKE